MREIIKQLVVAYLREQDDADASNLIAMIENDEQVVQNGYRTIFETRFTKRQIDVWRLIAEGFDGPSAAKQLGISHSAVKGHIGRILDILTAYGTSVTRRNPHVILAVCWQSELFRIGLKELNLLP